jgi:hypothetical protein
MKHLKTFESFMSEGSLSKKNGDGEIAVMKAHKAKAEKIMSDMGLSYEDLGPKDSSLMNYYKIPDTNWDVLNKIGAKVDLQSMTVLESEVNEASGDPTKMIKLNAIDRLSQFFRVPVTGLMRFNFDGKDSIKDLSKALNSTSDAGTEAYYKIAIKLAKEDLGILESEVNEAKEFDVKDLPVGAIVTFKDGETWKIARVIGNSSDPRGYMMAPHGKTKEHYISMQIEFTLKKLEDDIESVA